MKVMMAIVSKKEMKETIVKKVTASNPVMMR